MARKKKEDVVEERLTATEIVETEQAKQEQYGKSLVEEHSAELAILSALARQVTLPDDKPSDISLRDRAVLHLVATAELHRFPNAIDMQTHRIKRCIDIANLVVKLLGEEA